MLRWTDPAATPATLAPCVATFGNFDGVHRGHQAIFSELKKAGQRLSVPTVALTFSPHPVLVMQPEREFHLINSEAQRAELIAEQGIDGLCVVPFTREYAQTSPEDFVIGTFVRGMQAQAIVVGRDTRGFGAGGTGDVALLRELGQEHGFEVISLDDQGEGERWSSTTVRRHLSEGEVALAAETLGRLHRVSGTVVHGDHRGRELGFPTANLSQDSEGMVPADGVYAGWLTRVDLPQGDPQRRLPAAISVGTNPTFDGSRRTVESYVLDRTDLDLYEQPVMVEFVDRIRPMLRFESIAELVTAMNADVAQAHTILGVPTPATSPTSN